MVMRNRNGGGEAPHWWDRLPPQVRDRVAPPRPPAPPADAAEDQPPAPPVSRGELLADLSRLAALFVLVALGNILFLLVALTFLNS